MQLREKGKKDVITMGWDEAQAALQTGNYEVADGEPGAGENSGEGEGDSAKPRVADKAKAKADRA